GMIILVRGAMEVGVALAGRMSRITEKCQNGLTWGTVLAASLIVVSAISLQRNYRHPKQDYGGAMQFVEARRGAAERVVTVGEIGYVYKEYYVKPWTRVESAPQLETIRDQ